MFLCAKKISRKRDPSVYFGFWMRDFGNSPKSDIINPTSKDPSV
jgi:hypothetical protein